MKKRSKKRLLLNFLVTFIGFFIFSGSVTSVSFLLFFNTMEFPLDYIYRAAPITFYNLIFISAMFALLGTIWKKLSVEMPIDNINKALLRIKKGDFSSRLDRKYYSPRFSTIVNNINLMSSELSSLDALKVSLISNISHELKTPISIINNYATLLQDPALPKEKQTEYAKAITDSSKQMTELITNILKLNQLENQNIPSDFKIFDLGEQLCECLLVFEEKWEENSIEIETDIDDNITVNSDKELLKIVWNNIFSNAFKFTPNEGKISVTLKETNKYAIVEIKDTGCGIPQEDIENIFDKFYQCDTSRSTDGNGLGLALVKRIINITDCLISVKSELDVGTSFIIKVPKNKISERTK